MRTIPSGQFIRQAWKNGGGTTYEIAREEVDGSLRWRLSIACVEADGPFSNFSGLSRILTVIEGDGIELAGKGGTLSALPFTPVRFSGDEAIMGRLRTGAIRDFNLIFDAMNTVADVTVLHANTSWPLLSAPDIRGLFTLDERVTLNGATIPKESFTFFLGGEMTVAPGSRALAVSLRQAGT